MQSLTSRNCNREGDMIKSILISCVLLIFAGFPALADTGDVLHFDLSLAGYQLEMNSGDAMLVRPFDRMETYQAYQEGPLITAGLVDQVYLDSLEFNFRVEFIDEKIFKIIGRFSPAEITSLRETLFKTIGEGESKSKLTISNAGVEYQIIHDQWEFPEARLDLIGSELNTDFATLALSSESLAAKKRQARFHDSMAEQAATKD
jgi:hypothetical protein